MLYAALFVLVATALGHALSVQVPLASSQRWQDEHGGDDLSEWNLTNLPNSNTTDHLVFETVYSLLQLWPNARMRNGHTIVPGVIPKGTLLYHGRPDKELPSGPEWTATDPEHSYIFCRDLFNLTDAECWHLTLMTTRPLKVICFDGSSSVKLPYGSLDAQDLILWGRTGRLFEDEEKRIQDLCEWGKSFGMDAIVRMQTDFEVMLCDFTSGTSIVSFSNLASGWTSNRSIIRQFNEFEVISSGSWHYHLPGETRIQLDLPGLVSFYDTQLAPSLVSIRAGQERWDHRVLNISSEDLSAVKSRLEANLIRPDDASSGIDWKTLIQVIVDRYSQRLELTRYLVNSSATDLDDILDRAKKAQTQLRIMLTPYLLFSTTPTDQSDKDGLDWAIPIYKLCATTHTYSMESQLELMTDSEKVLLQAVRGTSREICRVVTKMWAAGVSSGIDPSLNSKASPDINEVTRLLDTWTKDLEHLMAWLDWNVWVKCDPGCGPEEMCYLPTWPVGFPWLAPFPNPAPMPSDDEDEDLLRPDKLTGFDLRAMVMGNFADEMRDAIKPEPDEWIRPQPRCIRRVKPYRF